MSIQQIQSKIAETKKIYFDVFRTIPLSQEETDYYNRRIFFWECELAKAKEAK